MTTHDFSIKSLRRPYQIMVLATLITAALVGLLLIPLAKVEASETTVVGIFELINGATWTMILIGLVAIGGIAYGVNRLIV